MIYRLGLACLNTLHNADELLSAYSEANQLLPTLPYSFEFGRGTCWAGYSNLNYRYAGRDHISTGEWYGLETLTEQVRALTNKMGYSKGFDSSRLFNQILINEYRVSNKLAWHSDDEACLIGPIASLSFGSAKPFCFRDNATKKVHNLDLGQGDFLITNRHFHTNHQHTAGEGNGIRYNITFRTIKDNDALGS